MLIWSDEPSGFAQSSKRECSVAPPALFHGMLTSITRCFNLELGLPLTGLDKLEDIVGLPDFSGPFSQEDYLANQASHFQEHFASQIVLRRLSMEFHTALTNCKPRFYQL